MNRTKQVVINIRNHEAWISESLLPLLADTLTQAQTELEWTGKAYVPQPIKIHLWKVDSGQVHFRAGLLGRVHDQLKIHGFEIGVKDQSVWPCLEKAKRTKELLLGLGESEWRLIKRIAEHPRGQLTGFSRTDQVICVALMARLFSGLHVLVISKNERQRHWIGKQVRGFLDSLPNSMPSDRGRLEFGCIPSLNASSWEFWDILIFADPESALADQTHRWRPLSRSGRQCYVLVPRGFVLDASEQLMLEMLCGPSIVDNNVQGQETNHARVVLVDGPPIHAAKQLTGLDWKRAAIWHNNQRNELIASMARECLGPFETDAISGTLGDCERSLAILVETPEHGRELRQRLPEFQLMTRDSATTCDPRLTHLQIGTHSFADQWGIEANVLIRADGTADWPLDGIYSALHAGSADPVLLVDLNDHGDRIAERNVSSRIRAYRRYGWQLAPSGRNDKQLANVCDDMNNPFFDVMFQLKGGAS